MDFAGTWQMHRRISNPAGQDATLAGQARIVPTDGGLTYEEAGLLRMVGGAAHQASRRYLWRQAGAMIAVSFADGRAFHAFDPADPQPTARHDCAPDLYLVRYDFAGWPVWRSEWRVTGPRKNYRMVSDFAPAPSG